MNNETLMLRDILAERGLRSRNLEKFIRGLELFFVGKR
ncbi:hypothetical protein TERMP_02219 (plasmid) [Thermococcus barophilus MP]|uniref:Uncharacterized protein n=1 Tax=Thermococcus barophilus (strain DSM 11836 / MP) TaxID=391623 RepID=F0LN53_THEBM|nr:hypothetical protein TERMP_02219 [Thermococcus barophilus MP]